MHEERPTVYRLPVHLEDEQMVYFDPEDIAEEVEDETLGPHVIIEMSPGSNECFVMEDIFEGIGIFKDLGPNWLHSLAWLGLRFPCQIPGQRFVELVCLCLLSFGKSRRTRTSLSELSSTIDRVFSKLFRLSSILFFQI